MRTLIDKRADLAEVITTATKDQGEPTAWLACY